MMAKAATAGGPLLAGSRRCPAADRPVGRHTTIRRGGNGHAEITALLRRQAEQAALVLHSAEREAAAV
jgi:hypothetical protein